MLETVPAGSVIVLRDSVETSVNVTTLIVHLLTGICAEVSLMCHTAAYEIHTMFDFQHCFKVLKISSEQFSST